MNNREISKMGKKLIQYSEGLVLPEISYNSLLSPYLNVASETMSLRQISKYIFDNFDYSISASTISRVINNRDEHYFHLAQYILKSAQWLALSFNTRVSELLTTNDVLEHEGWASPIGNLYEEIQVLFKENPEGDMLSKQSAVTSSLYDIWGNLPYEVQYELLEFMKLNPDE